MPLLTDRKRLERIRQIRETRKACNEDIKIYNTAVAMKGNPYSGDTTVLDFTVDNHTDILPQTEEDVINSVLFPNPHNSIPKSDVKLVPDMVCDEIKDFYRQKIGMSLTNNARAKQKMDKDGRLVTMENV